MSSLTKSLAIGSSPYGSGSVSFPPPFLYISAANIGSGNKVGLILFVRLSYNIRIFGILDISPLLRREINKKMELIKSSTSIATVY